MKPNTKLTKTKVCMYIDIKNLGGKNRVSKQNLTQPLINVILDLSDYFFSCQFSLSLSLSLHTEGYVQFYSMRNINIQTNIKIYTF